MAAPRLLAKTDLAGLAPVLEGGRAVIEQHPRLVALLAAHGLRPGLFAEPVITRGTDGAPTSVSWYGEVEGEPVPLTSLSPARRAEAEAALTAALASLSTALDDVEAGGLLRRALLVAEPDSILAVDGTVVLAGWGLVAKGTGGEPAALAARLREGVGRYHPALAAVDAQFFLGSRGAPHRGVAEPRDPGSAEPPSPPRETLRAAPPTPPQPPAPAQPHAGPPARSAAWWWMLPAALLIALLFLALGVWLGLRMCTAEFAGRELRAGVVDEAEARAMIARQREANSRLEREIANARAALQGEICRPAGPLAPLSPSPQGGREGEAPAPLPMLGSEPSGEGEAKAPDDPANQTAPRR